MKNRSVLYVTLAGLLWGLIGLFVKKLSAYGFDSIQITFLRLFIAAIIMITFLLLKDRAKLKFRLHHVWMFIGTGIISIVMFNVCYFYAVIHGEASIAVVLLYTSPIFIMIFSAILFKEKITLKKIIALILTIIGCIFVSGMLSGRCSISIAVFIIGICSGLFYGLYTIFGKYALKEYDSVTITLYTFIFGVIGSIPLINISNTASIIYNNPKSIIYILGIGFFCTLLPYYLYTFGLKYIDSGKASILVAVEPLVGTVIGMTILGEEISFIKICGTALILTAVILLNINNSKTK